MTRARVYYAGHICGKRIKVLWFPSVRPSVCVSASSRQAAVKPCSGGRCISSTAYDTWAM